MQLFEINDVGVIGPDPNTAQSIKVAARAREEAIQRSQI